MNVYVPGTVAAVVVTVKGCTVTLAVVVTVNGFVTPPNTGLAPAGNPGAPKVTVHDCPFPLKPMLISP